MDVSPALYGDIGAEVQVLGEARIVTSVTSVMCDEESVNRQTIRPQSKKEILDKHASAGSYDMAITLYM